MGVKFRWLAKIFAFFGAGVGLFGIGTFTQVNGISSAVRNFFDPNMAYTVALFGNDYSWATVISCLVLTVCVGMVVLGGIKRIAKVSEIVVPFMAVLYVVLAVIIMVTNITAIPAAIVTIVKSAFTGSALAGGAMGSMIVAMQKGIARGIFSNESGLGSAPIAAAAAQTKEPARQGLVSMTGTFIDTIVICTMTGLSIVITGTWNTGLEGVEITTAAFQKGLPFPPVVASFALMICLVFFAFTTILGWDYYGERCLEYLFNKNMKAVRAYRWLYIICVFIGPYMTVAAVWNIADIFNALMAIPNLIALLALSKVIVKETKAFTEKLNVEEKNQSANLSTGEKGWTDVEAEAMLSGRLLNNRLMINGNFGYKENVMANSNFVGDFEAIWLLTKNGDFRLRGYNQTNDRYFTKSTLTTQGVGLMYKKDFNTWDELFRWFLWKRRKSSLQKRSDD